MASLTALQQAVDEIETEITDLNAVLSDSETSEEAKAETDKQIDALMPKLEVARKRAKREEEHLAQVSGGSKPRQIQGDVEGEKPKPVIPATAKRFIVRNMLKEEIDGKSPEERAYLLGETILAAAAKTNPGRFHKWSDYVRKHEDRYGSTENRQRQIMGAATEGGNAGVYVPEQQTLDVISQQLRYGVARSLADVVTMTSEVRKDIKEGSLPEPTFTPELTDGSDVTPDDDFLIELVAKKLTGFLVWSSEVSEDAITEMGDRMVRRLAQGFAKKEDECMFNGDGSSTYGGMHGVRTKIAGIASNQSLITGTGTTWSSLVNGDFDKVVARLPDYADQGGEEDPNAVWVCHRTFFYEVMIPIMEAAGGNTMAMLMGGPRARRFKGYPVRLSNVFPSATATSSVVCTFGDHMEGVRFGDRRAFALDFSTEATIGSIKLFQADGIGARGTERFDINVHSPGTASQAGPIIALRTGS